MQETPRANRPHIAVFGRRNVGKSSLINALTNQELALVSEVAGTTADPVYKNMELLPLGPVVMIDTAGIDDSGKLGELRVKKTEEVMRRTDLALLVVDPEAGLGKYENKIYERLSDAGIPVIIVINKIDRVDNINQLVTAIKKDFSRQPVAVSARERWGIEPLRDRIAEKMPPDFEEPAIIGDLLEEGDHVILVVPIDSAAPRGRLILPQVQTIRDILDHHCITTVCKDTELARALASLSDKPAMVVTDSQAFDRITRQVPPDIVLTGFSVLFARYKGDLNIYLRGARKMDEIKAGDRILIAEACTHRRQADDIGTVKIPRWLREKVSSELEFNHVSGREYPEDLADYDLVLHCGGCMLNRREILSRIKEAEEAGVPVINYGMAIAYLHGILDRALEPFPEIHSRWLEYCREEEVV
ncbi:MAG: [FeFe] hydrogenase H-cluster maturation GTPase HydF [Bacillota bacterium]